MEIVPGIHRLEPYIGKKLVAHHLLTGDCSLLIDAATPEVAREALLPWLSEVLGKAGTLNMILITHADVDHFGGLSVLKEAYPHALIFAPEQDRRWIESTEAIFAERYDAYHAEHGLTYDASLFETLHAWHGPPVPVDIGLVGGENIRLSQQRTLQVLHAPGHTPGHLLLWEPRERIAIIGDALNGATQLDRDGAWTAPPPYTDRDLYLMSIQTLQALDPQILLTGHYSVMHHQEAIGFINASRDFVYRIDAVVMSILENAQEPVTLKYCIERANPLLGPFNFPRDLQFALEAHLSWLERRHEVERLQSVDGSTAWKLAIQGIAKR